jgi:hypothetical protein
VNYSENKNRLPYNIGDERTELRDFIKSVESYKRIGVDPKNEQNDLLEVVMIISLPKKELYLKGPRK